MYIMFVQNGEEYEPATLTSYICSVEGHLRKHNYPNSITDSKDLIFSKTRDMLKKKHRQVRTLGKGNKPNAADAISDNELETFYKTSNWYPIMERQTITRTSSIPPDVRILKPRAYAIPEFPDRNSVALYKLYSNQRPESMCQPDSPFFLSVNAHGKPGSKQFKSQPFGMNNVYSIMKDMKIAATDKNLTNYSARKHLVQKLCVPPNQNVQVTGHKNVSSLNNYSKMNENQQQNVSCILSNNGGSTPFINSYKIKTPVRILVLALLSCNINNSVKRKIHIQ
ncbi:LOW QUALITY PROTEIN: hypothetical protein KUTeg_022573, partial [Tegillarca granosa]